MKYVVCLFFFNIQLRNVLFGYIQWNVSKRTHWFCQATTSRNHIVWRRTFYGNTLFEIEFYIGRRNKTTTNGRRKMFVRQKCTKNRDKDFISIMHGCPTIQLATKWNKKCVSKFKCPLGTITANPYRHQLINLNRAMQQRRPEHATNHDIDIHYITLLTSIAYSNIVPFSSVEERNSRVLNQVRISFYTDNRPHYSLME